MTETGILNRDIAAELARMGHTDRLLIADAGLATSYSSLLAAPGGTVKRVEEEKACCSRL